MLQNPHHFLQFDTRRTGYDYARLIALESQGDPQGYCLVHVRHHNRGKLDTRVDLYLDEVWIEPTQRGKGLARLLLRALCSVADEALDRMGPFRKVRVLAHAVSTSGAQFTRNAQKTLCSHLDENVELALSSGVDLRKAPAA